MSNTKIEWADKVWNPVTGCTKISEGCRNCYAETFAERWRGIPGHPYEQGFDLKLWPDRLDHPLKWKKPQRIFVNSMSDLFHEKVPDSFIGAVWAIMQATPQHTYLILTKRPERMKSEILNQMDAAKRGPARWWMEEALRFVGRENLDEKAINVPEMELPLKNVWLGVSIEDQKTANERIPLLLETPAALRFVSAEPLLGPVDLFNGDPDPRLGVVAGPGLSLNQYWKHTGEGPFPGVNWVIVGGESGHNARPMNPEWVKSLRDQCEASNEAYFFFKQWGKWGTVFENMTTKKPIFRKFKNKQQWINKANCWMAGGWAVDMTGKILKNGKDFDTAKYPIAIMHNIGKKKAGSLLDGKEYKEFPG